MLYQRPSFTCPAAPHDVTQVQWDFATMSEGEFINRYHVTEAEYHELSENGV